MTLFFCPSDGGAAASGAVKHAYVLLLSRSHKHFAAAATAHNSEAADAINKQIYYYLKKIYIFFFKWIVLVTVRQLLAC